MLKGLFTSIFGATDQGIFDALYSNYGTSPPVKRMDIRLGDYGEDPPEEEEDAPAKSAASPAASPAATPAAPPMSAAPASSQSGGFFMQDIAGFPLWLVGIAFLGFAWSYRRKSKKQAARRK